MFNNELIITKKKDQYFLKEIIQDKSQAIKLWKNMNEQAIKERKVANLLEFEQWKIKEVKKTWLKAQTSNECCMMSYSTFLKMIHNAGMSCKKVVFRNNETDCVKRSRIWFFVKYAELLYQKTTTIFYFDWSSFGESNFKKNAWSTKGVKAVSAEKYAYRQLHLLTLLGKMGIQNFQFIKGGLSAKLIFWFLHKSIQQFIEDKRNKTKKMVVVMDNSPLNNSKALKHYAYFTGVTILFPAPCSSFQNPVEMLYAKIKQCLKQIFFMTELTH